MKNTLKSITTSTIAILVSVSIVHAIGTLTPIGTAGDDTQYTLNDIYHKLTTGADAVEGQGQFITPGGVPNASFRTLTEIYDVIPEWRTISNLTTLFDAGYYEAGDLSIIDTDLIENNIRDGITIFGIEGTVVDADDIPAQTISPNSTNIPYGVYDATTLDEIDTDLIAENIKQGVTIFGIEGELEEAAPGIVWSTSGTIANWSGTITFCQGLAEDGGGWRLPTILELLDTYLTTNPGNSLAFQNVTYWSTSEYPNNTASAYYIAMVNGDILFGSKNTSRYARCVK
jgi:hypothetical protein